jgi:hypothetical protein
VNHKADPEHASRSIQFVPDSALGYLASCRFPSQSQCLTFDETYRYAHLPLVAPDHPDVTALYPERGYAHGQHRTVHSLVIPVDWEEIYACEGFRSALDELRHGPLGHHIAWDNLERRKQRLHATICGSLPETYGAGLTEAERQALRSIGPFQAELRGFFSGNLNTGRLYIKLYPEQKNGIDTVHAFQSALGRPATHLYLVGLLNLTDHLDAQQSQWLGDFLQRNWDQPTIRVTLNEIWLMESRDDLVLDANIVERVQLR